MLICATMGSTRGGRRAASLAATTTILLERNVVDMVWYVLNVIFESAIVPYSCAAKFNFHWL